ncbi:hypothetical protein C8J57DRAFT_1595564 [Mycena rebaudengoi]|nr:hypothetical protein C8J57DRAFT_1595564 [Mycena rebaudengoi]
MAGTRCGWDRIKMQCAGCAGWEEDGGHGGVGAKREADGGDRNDAERTNGAEVEEGIEGRTQHERVEGEELWAVWPRERGGVGARGENPRKSKHGRCRRTGGTRNVGRSTDVGMERWNELPDGNDEGWPWERCMEWEWEWALERTGEGSGGDEETLRRNLGSSLAPPGWENGGRTGERVEGGGMMGGECRKKGRRRETGRRGEWLCHGRQEPVQKWTCSEGARTNGKDEEGWEWDGTRQQRARRDRQVGHVQEGSYSVGNGKQCTMQRITHLRADESKSSSPGLFRLLSPRPSAPKHTSALRRLPRGDRTLVRRKGERYRRIRRWSADGCSLEQRNGEWRCISAAVGPSRPALRLTRFPPKTSCANHVGLAKARKLDEYTSSLFVETSRSSSNKYYAFHLDFMKYSQIRVIAWQFPLFVELFAFWHRMPLPFGINQPILQQPADTYRKPSLSSGDAKKQAIPTTILAMVTTSCVLIIIYDTLGALIMPPANQREGRQRRAMMRRRAMSSSSPTRPSSSLGSSSTLMADSCFGFFGGVPVRLFFHGDTAMAAACFGLLEVVEARGDMRRDKTKLSGGGDGDGERGSDDVLAAAQ